MNRKITKFFGYTLAVLMFLIGALIFTYPQINSYTLQKDTETTLDAFHYLRDKASNKNSSNSTDNSNAIYDFNALYRDMQEYNDNIFKNGQSGLKDVWSYEQSAFDLSQYGVFDSAVAEIRIPKMNVDLPVYLGADRRNMARGAAQLGQTSMPIGGNDTNCVIAGHRGSSGGKFFLDIEKLDINDRVYIDNLWETLTYRVCKIDIISPDDIDKILIQQGRDMVTLITCHPYPYNYQRYVVYCERVQQNDDDNGDISDSPVSSDTVKIEDNSQIYIVIENILYYAVPVLLVILAFFLFRKRKIQK